MGIYTNNARGIQLGENAISVDIDKIKGKIDFIVARGVDGTNVNKKLWLNPRIGENVTLADNLGVPLVMLFAFSVDDYIENAPEKLPDFDEKDRHVSLLDQAIFIGSTKIKRKISAIIIEATSLIASDGRVMTETNYKNYLAFFVSGIWNRYKIPVYIYADNEIMKKYWGKFDVMNGYLSGFDGMCSFSSLTPGALPTTISVDNIPVPNDYYKVSYICNAPYIHFTKYASTAYILKEIRDASGNSIKVPLWQYFKPKATLFNTLGFIPNVATPIVTPTTPETPIVTQPTVSIDLSELQEGLEHLKAEQDAELQEEKKQTALLEWLVSTIKRIFNLI